MSITTNNIGLDFHSEERSFLIEKIKQADSWAMGIVYEEYSSILYGYFIRSTYTIQVAHKLLDQLFEELPATIESFNPEQQLFFTFLLGLSKKLAKGWHDDNTTEILLSTELPDNFLDGLLEGFTAEEREILVLVYYRGYSLSEIVAFKGWEFEKGKIVCRDILKRYYHSKKRP